MVKTQAQRAEAAVTQMLASVSDCSAADLRSDLERSKAIASKLAAFQVRAAAALAARERHGDGGAGVLRHVTGASRRQAESRARTALVLEEIPAVREALEEGRVSFTNAARLAQAAEGTEAGAVEADADLLAKAESMPDDQFAREARRWTARHQPDQGEADYQRRRARRSLRLWDGDDGMTYLRGEFDPVTGERIRNRLEAEARRLRGTDTGGGAGRRSFTQAMADALDGLTAVGSRADSRARSGHRSNDTDRPARGSDTSSSKEDPPRSPTWRCCAGTATTRSTTTNGSSPAATGTSSWSPLSAPAGARPVPRSECGSPDLHSRAPGRRPEPALIRFLTIQPSHRRRHSRCQQRTGSRAHPGGTAAGRRTTPMGWARSLGAWTMW